MTRKKWASDVQHAWLVAEYENYKLADVDNKKRAEFYTAVNKAWLEKWPLNDPTNEEIAKHGGAEKATKALREDQERRVNTWFRNRKRTPVHKEAAVVVNRGLLKLRHNKRLQSWQAYGSLTFDSKWKPEFDRVWQDYKADWTLNNPGQKIPKTLFEFRNTFIKEKYENESEDMKAKVEVYRNELVNALSENEGIEQAVQKLPRTLANIGESILQQTGWHVMILVGGPMPSRHGDISTFIYHSGNTDEGKSFAEWFGEKKFEESITNQFDDYLHVAFSPEKRAERALESESNNNSEEGEEDQSRTGGDGHESDEEDNTKRTLSDKNGMKAKLSEYERTRAENIAKRDALLEDLKRNSGLGEALAEMGAEKKKNTSKTKVKKDTLPSGERRTSSRQAGKSEQNLTLSPMHADLKEGDSPNNTVSTSVANDGDVQMTADEPKPGTQAAERGPESNSNEMQVDQPKTISGPVFSKQTAERGPESDSNEMQVDQPKSMEEANSPEDGTSKPNSTGGAPVTNTAPSIKDKGDNDDTTTDTVGRKVTHHVTTASTCQSTSSTTTALPSSSTRSVSASQDGDGGVPPFLSSMIHHLRNVSSNDTWQDLLAQLLEFERHGPGSGKLSTNNRPVEVAPWVKRHLGKKHEPVAVGPDYGARFLSWWRTLQPSWRLLPDGQLSKSAPAGEQWLSLGKSGSSGLYLVVVALSWWVQGVGADELGAWRAVEDVAWVLRQARSKAAAIEVNKRRADDESGGQVKRRRS